MTAAGKILVDQEELPLELLQKRVQAELGRAGDSVFILCSDKQVEYGKVVAVLDELKLAGAQRISIATERKEQ